MNIFSRFSSLEAWKKHCIYIVILMLISSAVTYHYTAKHYQEKYDTLNSEYTNYKANHPDATETKTSEQAIIDKALNDKKNDTPVTETIGTESKTTIGYAQKQSADDADIEITNTANPVLISYNGKTEALKTTTSENQTTNADGKVVITQQTSAVLDITDTVNRAIAQRVLDDEHKEEVLRRQKTQQTVWGVVAGVAIGYAVKK